MEREKILIVDDNRENIDILLDLFKGDYKVTVAITPERAIKIARSDSPPDIILLDILMPGMDGYEVCALLKGDPATQRIPIVFVTAVSEVMDAARGFALGAVDYITKPFHPPMVQARVAMHLSLKRKQEMLEEFAFIDALTEIPNRRRFDEVAEQEWSRSMRSGKPMSLLLMDVDHFKEYNDTYGHGRGDTALRRLAQAMADTMRRAGDFVARYGGEEFVAVLPYTDAAKARETAGRVMDAVEALAIEHSASPVAPHLTISVGVLTATPRAGLKLEQALEAVDQALYAAKHQGRRCVKAVEL